MKPPRGAAGRAAPAPSLGTLAPCGTFAGDATVRLMLRPLYSLAFVPALAALLGWGVLDRWFDRAPEAPAAEAVAVALGEALRSEGPLHPATAGLYARPTPVWTSGEARARAAAILAAAAGEGIDGVGAERTADLMSRLARAESDWAALDGDARDTLADPRVALLAALDVRLADGSLRYADALRGRRVDAASLHRGTWFPTVRDSTGEGFGRVVAAVRGGNAARLATALEGLRPRHAQYAALRARYAALSADLAPIPDGADLRRGERSVRVPHLRARLEALGALGPRAAARPDGWDRSDPYLFDGALAGALAAFERSRGLDADSVLDADAAGALNADLRGTLAMNLERWRWLPDSFGDRYIWVNLASMELSVMERAGADSTAVRLHMPVNIGNAQTIGWTTPVITDSVHTVEFQPAWYVPASLAASNVFPMARADSLSLYRQGFETYWNGRSVDSRLVPWDSVSVREFRFVQRPGPSNPLGRVKFLMHNPYAILIHDTNRPQTLADGHGSTMSSGCVQAGDPAGLAEYLLTTVNGWEDGEATAAWRGGPRRGVRLDRPFPTHFVYLSAWVTPSGVLETYGDPYGYDARLAQALAVGGTRPGPGVASAS